MCTGLHVHVAWTASYVPNSGSQALHGAQYDISGSVMKEKESRPSSVLVKLLPESGV
jgi:hypothetical protein